MIQWLKKHEINASYQKMQIWSLNMLSDNNLEFPQG